MRKLVQLALKWSLNYAHTLSQSRDIILRVNVIAYEVCINQNIQKLSLKEVPAKGGGTLN
jgi:hypothetical protein